MADSDQNEDSSTARPVITAKGEATLARDTLTSRGDIRRNFASSHLNAAKHFAEQLRLYEEEHVNSGWGPHSDWCRWYASAAIILSFSAIEAAVDEAEDDLGLPRRPANAPDLIPTLEKVQALLARNGSSPFDEGRNPFQSAETLRSLRNGLVHPRAEWDSARDRNEELNRKLVRLKSKLSPFLKDPDLAFPYGCMSAGIAAWAETTARDLISELRARLSLKPLSA
jgi:hypothetical protein